MEPRRLNPAGADRRAGFRGPSRVAVLVLVALLAACGPPVADDDLVEGTEALLSVWAAAAREYRVRTGGWPEEVEALDRVLRDHPTHPTARVGVLRADETGDGSLTLAFEGGPPGGGGGGRPVLQGAVRVSPPEVEGVPAAVISWRSGSWVRGRWGETTMQSCALGEWERPEEGTMGEGATGEHDPSTDEGTG
jgi:hypothetical protein